MYEAGNTCAIHMLQQFYNSSPGRMLYPEGTSCERNVCSINCMRNIRHSLQLLDFELFVWLLLIFLQCAPVALVIVAGISDVFSVFITAAHNQNFNDLVCSRIRRPYNETLCFRFRSVHIVTMSLLSRRFVDRYAYALISIEMDFSAAFRARNKLFCLLRLRENLAHPLVLFVHYAYYLQCKQKRQH